MNNVDVIRMVRTIVFSIVKNSSLVLLHMADPLLLVVQITKQLMGQGLKMEFRGVKVPREVDLFYFLK